MGRIEGICMGADVARLIGERGPEQPAPSLRRTAKGSAPSNSSGTAKTGDGKQFLCRGREDRLLPPSCMGQAGSDTGDITNDASDGSLPSGGATPAVR